jgi:hypothetical protein
VERRPLAPPAKRSLWTSRERLARRPGAPAPRVERECLHEVPAEVELGADDLVLVIEGKDLGVPSSTAAGDVGLVGDDHLVAGLDQPDEIEVLTLPRPRPTSLEVAVTVELGVRRGGEDEIVAQAPFKEPSITGRKGSIGVAGDLLAIGADWPSLVVSASREERERVVAVE